MEQERHLCRFCGIEAKISIPIFEGPGLEMGLETKISRHLPLHVSHLDSLPQQICFPCADRLTSWDSFVTLCLNTEAKFQAPKTVDLPCDFSPEQIKVVESDEEKLDVGFDSSDEDPLEKIKRKMEDKRKKKKLMVSCEHCQGKFVSKEVLEKHVLRCLRIARIPCGFCGKKYRSVSYLVKHVQTHQEEQNGKAKRVRMDLKFSCKYCPERFESMRLRADHYQEVHRYDVVKCEYCGVTGQRHVIQRHMQYNHPKRKYTCNVCPAGFATPYMLKQHTMTHTDVRCYICDICGKRYKRLSHVKDHMKGHEEKSNQCQVCGKFFLRKRYMLKHLQAIHNLAEDGSKNIEVEGFECDLCGAKLRWKQNLKAHMRIHTGEKPYTCKICNGSFQCHGSLRSHMMKHEIVKSETLLKSEPLCIVDA